MIIKYLLPISCVISSLFFHTNFLHSKESAGYQIIENKALIPLKSKDSKDRKIAKIKLDNGLQAILVSDPTTDQSAATLVVEAGSWQDPKEYPGIAHFLEHMLFLGTKQFPNESEYQKFISEHGGTTNAFTTSSYTAYVFSVDNQNFKESLERFSSFFKDPLFNPSGVARELNAIDQEYAKNLENDDIREVMVLKELGNPNHPNSGFAMGNSNTLKAVSQETLKKWYQDNYSANLMHLYVVSNLPIDELINQTVIDFGAVKNNDKKPFIPQETLVNPGMEGKFIYIQPIKNIRTLTIVFELPKKFSDMQLTRPDRLLCHVLGHEGKESLLAYLKKENLAETLACSSYDIGAKNTLLYVELGLTDEGLKKMPQVIQYFFDTLAMLKKDKYADYLFNEVQMMNKTDYEYQKREDAFDHVMKIASLLVNEPIETFPEESYIVKKFSPEDVSALIEYMTPQNARFYIKAPQALTNVKPDRKEKWLQVNYAVVPIEKEMMDKWINAKPIDAITLPAANPFLPKSLEVYGYTSENKKDLPLIPTPKTIVNNNNGIIYYAKDERYDVPKLYLYFNIKTPSIEMGKTGKAVIADLYVKGVEELLSRFSYPATMSGLKFDIDQSPYGINFVITGYSDNASLLFDEIVKVLKNPEITEAQFNVYKESLSRDFQNFNKEAPYKRALEQLQNVIYKNYSTKNQKAFALKKLTFDKFDEAIKNLYKNSYVEGLIYGNVTEGQAKVYANKILKELDSRPYPKKDQKKPLVIDLPTTKGPFYLESKIPVQGSSAILAIENPHYSFKERAAQQVAMQAIVEPFFSDLRTKQQTGYIVTSAAQEEELKLFDLFIVQSNTHDPRDLLARFELFIEGFLQEIGKTYLTEQDFETIRSSILSELLKPQNNMDDMGTLLKTLSFKYEGDFEWMNKRIEALKNLTYEEFVQLTKEFLGKSNKRRLGILMKGDMPEERVLNYAPLPDVMQLKKLSTYEPIAP